MVLGNGLLETHDYAAPGIPTVLMLGTSATYSDTLTRLEYNFKDGNVASQIIKRGGGTWAQYYRYDAVDRLACAMERTAGAPADCSAAAEWKQTFEHDRFGNRWAPSSGTNNLAASTDVHQPIGSGNFNSVNWDNRLEKADSAFDDAGNQTHFAPYELAYDMENHLTGVTATPSGGTAAFLYDGLGRRVRKMWTTGGVVATTYYVYGLDGQLAAEYSSETPDVRWRYVFADLLGNIRAVSDDPSSGDASLIECYDYLPFGQQIQATDGSGNTRSGLACLNAANAATSKRFTGQERDEETNLDNFLARFFNSPQGRFLSPDWNSGNSGDVDRIQRGPAIPPLDTPSPIKAGAVGKSGGILVTLIEFVKSC
jgi:RHS repeat-associated protein